MEDLSDTLPIGAFGSVNIIKVPLCESFPSYKIIGSKELCSSKDILGGDSQPCDLSINWNRTICFQFSSNSTFILFIYYLDWFIPSWKFHLSCHLWFTLSLPFFYNIYSYSINSDNNASSVCILNILFNRIDIPLTVSDLSG